MTFSLKLYYFLCILTCIYTSKIKVKQKANNRHFDYALWLFLPQLGNDEIIQINKEERENLFIDDLTTEENEDLEELNEINQQKFNTPRIICEDRIDDDDYKEGEFGNKVSFEKMARELLFQREDSKDNMKLKNNQNDPLPVNKKKTSTPTINKLAINFKSYWPFSYFNRTRSGELSQKSSLALLLLCINILFYLYMYVSTLK